jgi:hypothetical protein
MKLPHFLILAAGLVVSAEMAAADVFIHRLIGVFVGEGTIRPQGFDDAVKVKCRLVGKPHDDLQVNLEGKCVTASGAGKVRFLIAQDQSGTKFAAKAGFASQKEMVALNGRRSGENLVFLTKAPFEASGRLVSSEIIFALAGEPEFDLSNTLTDRATGEVSQVLSLKVKRKR